MTKKGTFHIAIITGNGVKAVKDLTSGFLRYKAETKPLWNIKFFTSLETQTAVSWRQNVIAWRPDGIVVAQKNAIAYLSGHSSAISRNCKIVFFASGDPKLDGSMPPRTIFVGIDDTSIVEAAFNLMRERGLENFAFVNAAEVTEILRSRRRAAALRRMANEAGFPCTECGTCRDDNWTSRLTSLANELSTLPMPCGVMAYNDRCAREVIDACNLAGLSIPSQIQVVGVDDQQEICENVRPRLTSIEPDFEGNVHATVYPGSDSGKKDKDKDKKKDKKKKKKKAKKAEEDDIDGEEAGIDENLQDVPAGDFTEIGGDNNNE